MPAVKAKKPAVKAKKPAVKPAVKAKSSPKKVKVNKKALGVIQSVKKLVGDGRAKVKKAPVKKLLALLGSVLVGTVTAASVLLAISHRYSRIQREIAYQRFLNNNARPLTAAPRRAFFNELPQPIPLGRIQAPRPDTQNVHDSQVNNLSKKIYKRLSVPPKDQIPALIEEIRREFHGNTKITKVIDEIVRRHRDSNTIIGLKLTELQCLAAVWVNVKNNNDKKRYFQQSLEDCLDTLGFIVCQTGVINRIVVATVIDKPEDIPRNFTTELGNEITRIAIRVREAVLANQELRTDEIRTREYQRKLREEVNTAYKDIIKSDELEQVLLPFLDACC